MASTMSYTPMNTGEEDQQESDYKPSAATAEPIGNCSRCLMNLNCTLAMPFCIQAIMECCFML
ncbi:hypothetical protein TUN199_02014 [Pyrenophora tritici-repentis]|nr:hypothetical protein PtrV1_08096 [Pyrenophora tritici-repentis]KAF7449141.1 hypothetical protein A1F99_061900 [Pyrenophora tritici-repentis]KAI0626014.1 hypothetical protein TUN199_02014 [Pyrenophora tritici-repentis]PZD31387.1 hypothetical protein A1F96_03683 [Pyrenophora tritici-repentis]